MSSILAGENQITISRGESATIFLQVLDSTNAVVDLTGGKVYFTVKVTVKDTTPLIQKTSDLITQIVITYPRLGKCEIILDASNTNTLDVGTYTYDIWVMLSSGKKYPVIKPSVFEIEESVTRFAP